MPLSRQAIVPVAGSADEKLPSFTGYCGADMKDAKGHGSNARSGSAAMNDEAAYRQRHTITYTKVGGEPADPQAVSGGQPVASNAHAAATLAGGAKSAPVDTHPAMADAAGLSGRNWGSPRDAASYHIAGSSRVANARYDRENPGPNEGPRKGRWPKDVMKD